MVNTAQFGLREYTSYTRWILKAGAGFLQGWVQCQACLYQLGHTHASCMHAMGRAEPARMTYMCFIYEVSNTGKLDSATQQDLNQGLTLADCTIGLVPEYLVAAK